jgi:hypothetical protein
MSVWGKFRQLRARRAGKAKENRVNGFIDRPAGSPDNTARSTASDTTPPRPRGGCATVPVPVRVGAGATQDTKHLALGRWAKIAPEPWPTWLRTLEVELSQVEVSSRARGGRRSLRGQESRQ